jgi:hypothetical protein
VPAPFRCARDAIGSSAAEIRASAKMLAFRTQDDRADIRSTVIDLQRVGDLRHHVGIDEIVWAAPNLDRCDMTGTIDCYVFIGSVLHGGFLLSWSMGGKSKGFGRQGKPPVRPKAGAGAALSGH